MTVCTFAGHRDGIMPKIEIYIAQKRNELLRADTHFVFYSGGMGDFDKKCESVVRILKRQNSHLNIELVLVLPYMTNRLSTEKKYYESQYDDVIIPQELYDIHYKVAIKKRNRWIVDKSDWVMTHICRDFGGAYDTARYARKKGKHVIDIADDLSETKN